MKLKSGDRVGPYEIVSHIGEGGMGEVWKARDTRLGRLVALKTSQAMFSERFEREAHAIAALNHPHICTLYDVGPDYLIMEYVEGVEIKGPLPLDQALQLAIQLAGALEAAHRTGITHRDLKPANILRTKSGVKVLDFGLARISRTAAAGLDETVTEALTQEGAIVGTLQYMAPEQLQGQKIDTRVDIFSFGCVLYEMLSGKKAFDGSNKASVIAAILERPAPSLGQVAPATLDWILRRCLAKDPEERWQSVLDLRAALLQVAESGTAVENARLSSRFPSWVWVAAIGVPILIAATVGFVYIREPRQAVPMTRTDINPPEGYALRGMSTAVSPDGRQVVFLLDSSERKRQLWLRPLDSPVATPLNGTEGASLPFWSPDSKWIGFFAAGKLKKMPVSGGPAKVIADAKGGRGGTWNRDDVIVFAPNPTSGLLRVSASGGSTSPATPADTAATGRRTQRFPWFLPDGNHFVYMLGGAATRIGSLDSPTKDVPLDVAESQAYYSQGYLFYVRDSTLMARPFDAARLVLTGEEMSVAEHVVAGGPTNSARFYVSANGVLVYQAAKPVDRVLTWFDRSGKQLGPLGDPGALGTGSFAPDRKTIAVSIREPIGRTVNIWLYDVSNGSRRRFTSDPASDTSPIWSPDGRTIVFASNRTGTWNLYRKPVDGSTSDQLLYADSLLKLSTGFSPDGKYLAYNASGDPKTGMDIGILSNPLALSAGGLRPGNFMQSVAAEQYARFSPDGQWIAYESDESGRFEICLASFPGPGVKRQISTTGGSGVRWRPDGKELYYLTPDSTLMAAQIDTRAPGAEVYVRPLFKWPEAVSGYDVSTDGQRFLATLPTGVEIDPPLTIVQNWTAALKK